MSIDRAKYLSKNEVNQLRTITEARAITANQKHQTTAPLQWLLVDVALSTGLRVSELAAIKLEDIDFKRLLIKVKRLKRKKKITESLAVDKSLLRHIRKFTKNRKKGFLFIGQRGQLSAQGLQCIWKSAIKKANLPKELSIHCARHTVATHLLKKTGNLRQVQKQLGHASPTTTANMYADVSFDDMQDGMTGLYE